MSNRKMININCSYTMKATDIIYEGKIVYVNALNSGDGNYYHINDDHTLSHIPKEIIYHLRLQQK